MRRIALLAATAAMLAATAAHAQERRRDREISPYIEAGAVLTADLQSGDVLTYSTVAAGVDASVHNRRVEVQLSYKYERRFALSGGSLDDGDVHSGLARAAVAVAPGFSVEGGAIATRARADQRGAAPGTLAGNVSNVAQVYSGYVGPTVATHVGAININGAYRFGYTKAEAPGATGVAAGQPALDRFDTSTSHVATASVGVKSGTVLPVGLSVSGGWEQENAGQLEQKYEGKRVRGDVVLPVGHGLAIGGGGGYEKIEVSQKSPLVDGAGNPVTDANGRYVTDPASARNTVTVTDGIYWDVGLIWRPSRRTMVEARVGKRYDSWSYTGSISYAPSPRLGMRVNVYDGVQSFGRQLNDGLAMLPTSFNTVVDPFSDQFNGCVYGNSGAAGGCLNGVLQSISASHYRARGVDSVVSLNYGPLRMGFGGGYASRKFIAPPTNANFSVAGLTDSSVYGQFFVARDLDSRSGVQGTVFVNYFDSGVGTNGSVLGGGATGTYYRRIGPINASVSAGVYTFDTDTQGNDISAQALVGLRYGF